MDHYAWVTISGKVYVTHDELAEQLAKDAADIAVQATEEDEDIVALASREQIQDAFGSVALRKIDELCQNNDPIKLYDAAIDSSTIR